MPPQMRKLPMVRPPMHAGGGVGDPNGNSGAPGGAPGGTSGAKWARDEMVQRYALARGRFFERLFRFPDFDVFAAGVGVGTSTRSITVKSNGDSFVRLVAMRGVVNTFGSAGQGNNFEAKNVSFTLSADGLEDFTTSGETTLPVSFAEAFAEDSAPWLWLTAPPLLRVGETMSATLFANLAQIPEEVGWQGQLALRLCDDNVWCELYGYNYDDDGS
jgi:hypothetical protein